MRRARSLGLTFPVRHLGGVCGCPRYKERIELLEADLKAVPPRINVYHDLPFAILRYDPDGRMGTAAGGRSCWRPGWRDWQGMSTSSQCRTSLAGHRRNGRDGGGRRHWSSERGYLAAQEQVTTYLSDRDWRPLADLLAERLADLDPDKSIAFLTRVAAMSPGIYHMSKLLDQMQGKTRVTTILFYPGSIEGTTGLRFMDLKDRDALGNYRVKIYG